MTKHTTLQLLIGAVSLAAASLVAAQDTNRSTSPDLLQTQERLQERDRIAGYELMSQEERNAYMERLRQATTEEERERIRNEYRERMELRKRALNGVGNPGAGSGAGAGMGGKSPVVVPGPQGGGRH
jgi:hypothetical protein